MSGSSNTRSSLDNAGHIVMFTPLGPGTSKAVLQPLLIHVSRPTNSEAIFFCLLLKQDTWIDFHLKLQLAGFQMII